MAGLSHFWTDAFQNARTAKILWTWPVGEQQDYWGYCVRPLQANSDLTIDAEATTTDNDLNYIQNFLLTTRSGGRIRFSAIRVAGS
jgi:hypothetical protein